MAGGLLALLALAVFWLATQGGGGGFGRSGASGTNAALDVRYRYNPKVFQPAPYVANAEFPLQLDAETWSLYGKRIQGAGHMLGDKPPQSMLYDFVGSQQNDMFEYWYRLVLEGEPVYEDARLQDRLALHTQSVYLRTDKSRGWPPYFPAAITGATDAGTSADLDAELPAKEPGAPILDEQTEDQIVRSFAKSGGANKAYVEGWTLYTKDDLFFFYAISPEPLERDQRNAAVDVINSMQFGAVIGSKQPAPETKENKESNTPPKAPARENKPAVGD